MNEARGEHKKKEHLKQLFIIYAGGVSQLFDSPLLFPFPVIGICFSLQFRSSDNGFGLGCFPPTSGFREGLFSSWERKAVA